MAEDSDASEMASTCTCNDSHEEESNEFADHTWKEDLTLVVEGQCMYVAKAILGTMSPVFDKMFSSGFVEKDAARLELPDKKFRDVHDFLTCFYPGHENEVSEDNVDHILPLAHEYQIGNLITDCENVLEEKLEENRESNDIYETLYMAHLYNLQQLLKTCYTLASRTSYSDVVACTILPDQLKVKIFEGMAQTSQLELTGERRKSFELNRQIKLFKIIARYNALEMPYGDFLNITDVSLMDGAILTTSLPKAQLVTTRSRVPCSIFSFPIKVRLSSTALKFSLPEDVVRNWQIELIGGVMVQNETTHRRSTSNKFKLKFKEKAKRTCTLFILDVLQSSNDRIKFEIFFVARRQRVAQKRPHP